MASGKYAIAPLVPLSEIAVVRTVSVETPLVSANLKQQPLLVGGGGGNGGGGVGGGLGSAKGSTPSDVMPHMPLPLRLPVKDSLM